MKVIRHTKIGNKNIYIVIINENYAYTISQDKTIKEINLVSFELTRVVKIAVDGICKILGIYNGSLVIVGNVISIWSISELAKKVALKNG